MAQCNRCTYNRMVQNADRRGMNHALVENSLYVYPSNMSKEEAVKAKTEFMWLPDHCVC